MSGSKVLVSRPIAQDFSPVSHKRAEQPRVYFTRQLWQRNVPAEQDTASTMSTPSRSPRGSICSNTSDGQSKRLASISSLLSMPEDPQASLQHPASGGPHNTTTNAKRPIEQVEAEDDSAATTIAQAPATPTSSSYPCLCQPDQKIPRPRNAFILYRQHHNTSVINSNPQLSNPEISKIIGDQWAKESEGEKQRWKDYAEEDKRKHQEKYPDYRYQPRRSNKSSTTVRSVRSSGPWTEMQTCPKCNGQKLAQSPSIPPGSRSMDLAPLSTRAATQPRRSNTITLPAPQPSSTTTPSTAFLPMHNLSLTSPASARSADRAFNNFSTQSSSWPSEALSPVSPKRRRMEPYQSSPTRTLPSNLVSTMRGLDYRRRISMPPGPMSSMNAIAQMPPAQLPQPGLSYGQHRNLLRHGAAHKDLSLRLPPILTSISAQRPPAQPSAAVFSPSRPVISPPTATGIQSEAQKAAMIEMYQVWHKLKIVRQHLSPLPRPTSSSPRGALVAVEGDSSSIAREVADWLGEYFTSVPEIELTIMNGPEVPKVTSDTGLQAEQFHECVGTWHGRSREIATVTRRQRKASASGTAQTPFPILDEQARKHSSASDQSMSDDSIYDTHDEVSSSKMGMLLLRSYVTTATTEFARRLPHNGTDDDRAHWEWAASIWRGVVAPDVIVYVKDVEPDVETGKNAVEVVDEGRIILVRRIVKRPVNAEMIEMGENGRVQTNAKSVEGIPDSALRRVGFELGEWLRSFSAA